MNENNQSGLQISKKSFFSSMFILFLLMVGAGILTHIVPGGAFERTLIDGREAIVPGSFAFTGTGGFPVWRWLTAPIEVLWSDDAVTVIMIIAFICIIGGTFTVLDKSGMLRYIMNGLVRRFAQSKYRLMAVLTLFFMLFGSIFGIFEELVALVPIVILLSHALGWDSLTGLGFRIPVFMICYGVLYGFLYRYARKIERDPKASPVWQEDTGRKAAAAGNAAAETLPNEQYLGKTVKIFAASLGLVIAYIVAGFFVPALSSVSLPVMAVLFLVGGLLAASASHYGGNVKKDFLAGIGGIAPSGLLILMAMSVKLIITEGGIMDTILYYASERVAKAGPYGAAVMIFLLVLALNFFVSSGSAKAFLLMPILAPLAELVGLPGQVAVQAFCFGDGFTNMLYPTNAVLMITLGLTVVSYPKWFKWTIGLQLLMLLVNIALLLLAVAIGYGM